MKKILGLVKKINYIMNRPQKLLCLIVFAMSCFGAVLECIGVAAMIPLVSIITDEGILKDSIYLKKFPQLGSLTYNELVVLIGIGIVLIYVLKNLYLIFLSWIRVKFSSKIQREMTIKMMASYMSRGYSFFLNTNMGEILRGVSGDASVVFSVLSDVFRVFSDALTMLLVSIVLITTDWKLALMTITMAGICIAITFYLFRRMMYKAGVRIREYGAKSNQALFQAFEGVKDVLILRKQRHFISEYERNLTEYQKAICTRVVGTDSPTYMIEGLCITGMMIAVCSRILTRGAGVEFAAVLATFAVGAFRILPTIGRISAASSNLVSSSASVDAMYEHISEAEKFGKEHPELLIKADEIKISSFINRGTFFKEEVVIPYNNKFNDKLCFKNVSFRYNDEVGNILTDVSFEISKGQSVAFIGSSGAGKSTLVDILLGLLIPQQGQVLIDGSNITDEPDKWAQTVGYVPQSVYLADASIKENIAFGETVDKIDTDRINNVIERVELAEFIGSLPDGIETFVGDKGVRLSGGQRQRIAIARALYHDPDIMVLDEATSALDNETEEAVMSAIDALQGQVTLIIVAHRLTTIRNCDVIYEVGNKKIRLRDKREVLGLNQ